MVYVSSMVVPLPAIGGHWCRCLQVDQRLHHILLLLIRPTDFFWSHTASR